MSSMTSTDQYVNKNSVCVSDTACVCLFRSSLSVAHATVLCIHNHWLLSLMVTSRGCHWWLPPASLILAIARTSLLLQFRFEPFFCCLQQCEVIINLLNFDTTGYKSPNDGSTRQRVESKILQVLINKCVKDYHDPVCNISIMKKYLDEISD